MTGLFYVTSSGKLIPLEVQSKDGTWHHATGLYERRTRCAGKPCRGCPHTARMARYFPTPGSKPREVAVDNIRVARGTKPADNRGGRRARLDPQLHPELPVEIPELEPVVAR